MWHLLSLIPGSQQVHNQLNSRNVIFKWTTPKELHKIPPTWWLGARWVVLFDVLRHNRPINGECQTFEGYLHLITERLSFISLSPRATLQELIKMPLGKPVETIRTRNGSGGSGGWAGKDINGWRSGRCWLVTRTKRSLLTIRNTQMDIKFLAMVWLEPKGEGERTSNSNTNMTGPNESAAGICTTRAPCYVTIVIGTSISPSMEWRHVVNRVFVFCHKGCDNIRSGHNGTCWWWVADFMQITSGHVGNTLIGSRWMNEAHRDWLSTGGESINIFKLLQKSHN